MKRFTVYIFIFVLIVLAFCSCGEKNEVKYNYDTDFVKMTDVKTELPDIAFTSSFDNSPSLIGSFVNDGRFVMLTGYTEDGDIFNACLGLLIFNPDSLSFEFIKLTVTTGNDTSELSFTSGSCIGTMSDGSYVCLIQNPSHDINGRLEQDITSPRADNRYYLYTFSPDGLLTSSTLIYDIDAYLGSSGIYPAGIVDADDNVTLWSNDARSGDSRVCVVSAAGKPLYSFTLTEAYPDFAGGLLATPRLMLDEEGRAGFLFDRTTSDRGECEFILVNDTDVPLETRILPNEYESGGVTFADGGIYYNDIYGIYYSTGGEAECLLSWLDADMSSYCVQSLHIESSDRFVATYIDEYTFDAYIVVINRTDEPYTSEREVITVAYEEVNRAEGAQSMYARRAFLNIASEFNRESDKYRIKLIPYRTDDTMTANEKLMRDIIAGEIPDMVLFGETITPEPFIKTGTFRDLYKFIDKDDKYNRDAFLPCVLEPMETDDGELPYLTMNFTLDTIAGKSSRLGDVDSWTLDDLEAMVKSLDNGYLMRVDEDGQPESELLEILLRSNIDEYVDYEQKTCDFGEDFKKLLELCGDAPLLVSDPYIHPEYYENDEVLLSHYNISIMDEFLRDRFLTFGDDIISYVGAPRREPVTYGTAVIPDMCLSITTSCDDTNGAWEFICYYLDSGSEIWRSLEGRMWLIYRMPGFAPTWETTEVMFDMLEQLAVYVTADSVTLDNGYEGVSQYMSTQNRAPDEKPYSYDPNNPTAMSAWSVKESYIKQGAKELVFTPEDEELLREHLAGCTVIGSSGNTVTSIILEEAATYFAGAKTLDEVISIIENRVTTVINE